jgi:hypothetical protein
MKFKRRLVFVLLFAVTSAAVGQSMKAELWTEPGIPVVEFDAPIEQSEVRAARGQKYNTGSALKDALPERSAICELPLSHAPVKPAFPVSQSDAILIATVTDARAFLSPDKSSVYSEFEVKIGEVLMNDSPAALGPGVSTTAGRSGGIVRFPSGHTLELGNCCESFPQQHGRYVLFLKWNDAGRDFSIVTGYWLRHEKIELLDGLDCEFEIFDNYQQYRNEDETTFLKLLRTAIKNGG